MHVRVKTLATVNCRLSERAHLGIFSRHHVEVTIVFDVAVDEVFHGRCVIPRGRVWTDVLPPFFLVDLATVNRRLSERAHLGISSRRHVEVTIVFAIDEVFHGRRVIPRGRVWTDVLPPFFLVDL